MAASDDWGFDDDDTELLAAATQAEASQNGFFQPSPRPSKRRRLSDPTQRSAERPDETGWPDSDEEAHRSSKQATHVQTRATQLTAISDDEGEDAGYYFPGELGEQQESEKRHSKYRIHIPRDGGQFQDQVFTQTQHNLDSSPSHFRGAVWKKPKPAPPPPILRERPTNGNVTVHNNATNGASRLGSKQTTLVGFAGRAQDPWGPSKSPLANSHSLDISGELADLPPDAFSSSRENSPERDIVLISSNVTASQVQARGLRGPQHGLKQMTIFGRPATQDLSASQAANKKHAWPLKSRDEAPTHHKLNDKAMETWIYPTNLGTIRDYQYNIVSRSLFHNTLVALPTGLGKTFIAATVMLNYYRWTKDAQIVFMAPTKPLIAQQMDACFHIVGIPRHDTVLMTGETVPAIRAEEWLTRRVFFMTPQTVINDLKTGICDPKKTVLVVVDEAHKATGGYAYTEVIRFYRRFNNSFRVLALTATPGSTIEAVQAVIDALGISRVELRTEQSLDIREYVHEKHTETQLFDNSDEQALIMDYFSKALRPVLDKLCTQNAYWSRDPMQLSAYGLNQARGKYMSSDAGRKAPMPVKGMVNALFTVLSSLAHNNTLLKFHGIGPFYAGVREFQKNVESGQSKGKYATQIAQSEDFIKMMSTLRGWTNNPDFIGHPKLEYLREVVLNHFLDAGEGQQGSDVPPSATRVMVFASYRDSTEEICRVLKRNEPMIRPQVFVGQSASKGQEGMNQKKQNEVIQDFKSGKFNTLIATSIGEEGLDIGTVDLIVCYDASSSPIRMLQRMGRTGRKRLGKIVLLLMRGKEENDFAKAQDSYQGIQKSIADGSKYDYRDEDSPRIVPKEVQPVVDKRVIDIPVENSQHVDLNERNRRAKGKTKLKRPPKKFHMPDGVRTGFVKASRLESDDDGSASEALPRRKSAAKKDVRAKPQQRIVEPPIEPVQVPFLSDVLLSDGQLKDLERKYAYAADDDNDVDVRLPEAARFPESIRHQGPTKYVSHGRTSASVATAMRSIAEVNDEKRLRMEALLDMDWVNSLGAAGSRLVSPESEGVETNEDQPDHSLFLPKARAPAKARSKKKPIERTTSAVSMAIGGESNKASVEKKARGRPRETEFLQRTASIRSVATTDGEGSNAAPAARKRMGPLKKPIQRTASIASIATNDTGDPSPVPAVRKQRARTKKKRGVRRTKSYGSEAGEGDESSPEPTPANMRLGTQGIDLGSDDTSGEDEEEEPDSELAEFVVRSDQPIEMDSSSQHLLDDTQSSKPVRKGVRTLVRAAARTEKTLADSDAGSDESDPGIAALEDMNDGEDSDIQELPTIAAAAAAPAKSRRRRVVDEDSDE